MMEDHPTGFRFYPTEEELVSFYLHNQLEGFATKTGSAGSFQSLTFTPLSRGISQSFPESCAEKTKSSGSSSLQCRREKPEQGDRAEARWCVTGRQPDRPVTSTHWTTK
ncbi:hypothetical protein NL676_004683 [Syzygium grande]|nr:hypothetical protein NL676_004683 [Syzygium grande]